MKKFALIIVLLIISITAFSQTTISRRQIRNHAIDSTKIENGAVNQLKLADDALRPVNGGALPSNELIFGPDYRKKYTLAVTSNITLSLAAVTQTADSWIIIKATGNGSNTLFFPPEWRIRSGSVPYNPNTNQTIELYYDGTDVFIEIITGADVVTATLTAAEVVGTTAGQVDLVFNAAVNITSLGWTLESDGDDVNVEGVLNSGTNTPMLTLDRDIIPGEVVTISYNATVGSTTSLTNTPLASIGAFDVEVEDAEAPPDEDFTITVDDSGGQDFTTITAANAAAVSGDIIGIKTGTYRETIVAKSGVQYRGFAGETVIISGLDVISDAGWTVHSGSIYKKTVTLPLTGFTQTITSNTTLAANQIFDGGEMQIQARFPNATTKEEMFDLYNCRSQAQGSNLVTGTSGGAPSTAFQPTSLTDAGAAVGTLGNLTGGSIFINGWFISGTRTISGHSGNVISFPAYSNCATGNCPSNSTINVNYRKWWFATNKLTLLDIAREWHYEAGILYLHAGGSSPTGIEFKARNWGFDLSGKTDVIIRNITFVGCEVRGDLSTHRCTIDNIRASYTNHVFMATFGVGTDESYNAQQTGFRLIGNDNTITNSEFNFGASQCIWLGNNGKAINNKIENYGYEGNYGAGVTFWGNTSGQIVEHNTFTGFGRSAIDFSMTWSGTNANWKIRYNDISGYCKINNDGGAIYTGRYTTTTGGEIAYNWIHDSGALPDYENKRIEGILAALYFDQGTGPLLLHHNVFYNNWENMPDIQDRADFYILARLGTHTNTPASLIYNNTFASDWTGQAWSYITYITTPQDIQKNNNYDNQIIVNWGGNTITGAPPGGTTTVTNSVLMNVNPLYLGTGTGGLAYRLASTSSPGYNTGAVIAGITDGYLNGAPDIGAYEFNDPDPWVPGYGGPVTGGTDTFIDATVANVTYSDGTPDPAWSLPQNTQSGWYGNTISYSNVAGSNWTYTCTSCTRIKVYAERMATHGTGTIALNGDVTPDAVTFNTAPYGLQQLIYDTGVLSDGNHSVKGVVGSGFNLIDYIVTEP